ncbi:MAG: hypothetical protein WBG73_02535 [Coleofasciculaceae cyanobacterium]
MSIPTNHKIFRSQSPSMRGQLVCPHCQHSFPLTWRRYWSAPLGNYCCPQCKRLSHLKANSVWILPLQIMGIILVLGIPSFFLIYIFHDLFTGVVFLLIGILGITIPLDKWIDGHFKQLKPRKAK